MDVFIGTKVIKAEPMTRADYSKYRGWELPKDEDGSDEGFLVEYTDGGQRNHPDHEGYISWSPKNVFEKAYRHLYHLTFGMALEALKAGMKVTREGWSGYGQFIFLVPGSTFKVSRPPLNLHYPEGTEINYMPHIDIKRTDGTIATWAPSCSDALAEDYKIVL